MIHTEHDAHQVAQSLIMELTHGSRFVGLMGSRRHASEHLERIREDLGGCTPQEIALSILAGIVAVRNGRAGGRLA